MNIGFLITARLKSTRLKSKVLLPLNGRSAVGRVIERAQAIEGIGDVVVATSTVNQDLQLARVAIANSAYYFPGHPDDVLQRLLSAAKFFGMDYFLGITADNPLFCHYHSNLIALFVREHPEIDFVYTSGLPIGLNTYAIKVKALEVVCEVKKVIDTEIWGPLINRPDIFKVHSITASDEYKRDYRLTMDEPDDYALFKGVYEHFESKHMPTTLEIYKLLDADKQLASLNSHVIQRQLSDEMLASIEEYYRKNRNQIIKTKQRIYESA